MLMRDATPADAVVVAHLHAESWRSAYAAILDPAFLAGPVEEDRRSVWASRLARPSARRKVIIAGGEGQPVGFICAVGAEDARWGTLIDNLHVHPAAKAQGTGTLLLRAAAEWSLAACPGAGLHLWCFERNEPARHFYERRGGTVVERALHEAAGGGSHPAIRFHWPDPAGLPTAVRPVR